MLKTAIFYHRHLNSNSSI